MQPARVGSYQVLGGDKGSTHSRSHQTSSLGHPANSTAPGSPNQSLLSSSKPPGPYYLSPAGKHIRELFTKENCCNDCRKVGHNFKTCPNCCGPTHVNSRSVDNHKVLIQELTSQLDEHLQLEMTIDLDETMYTLFHPPLVIQASAAACNKPSGCCPLGQWKK